MTQHIAIRQLAANPSHPHGARKARLNARWSIGCLALIAVACGSDTETPPGYTTTSTTGNAGCPGGLSDCGGGQCVSTLSDGNHCGACGNACPLGQVCSGGACTATCAAGETLCGTSCANVLSNPQHCGLCNNACPSGTCNAGACTDPVTSASAVTGNSSTLTTGATTATTAAGTTGATTGATTAATTAATTSVGTTGTSASTTTGAGGSTASATAITTTGNATTGTVPVTCSTPLADRVTVASIPVSPSVDLGSGQSWGGTGLPVILATSPDGQAKVAWSDGDNVHITPLNASDQRASDDILVPGSEVRGLVAHDDGTAVLVVDGDQMVFLRLDASGTTQASLSIVGNNSHTTDGDRWIDSWPHFGRLAWSGTNYAAYFGQTGNHGAAGDHQGDHYSIINPAGAEQSGGWDWGCSHSLDVRLAHNGTTFAPICTSDTYPGAGIWFENDVEISPEPSITNTGEGTKLGGLVPAPDGFWLNFASPEQRSSYDVVFLHVGNDGSPSGRVYLTDTADVDERYAHLAAYGDGLLAGWGEETDLTLAVLDTSGNITEGPAAISAEAGGLDDFATYPNGDVGWAFVGSDTAALQIARVTRCE